MGPVVIEALDPERQKKVHTRLAVNTGFM